MTDIVERLRNNVVAQQGGPYVSLKENRDAQTTAADEIGRLRNVLDKLSRLGNEPMHGNSDGNLIAYRALHQGAVKDGN